MFYSQTTRGFYDFELHGDNIPADAVEITSEEHAALLAGQAQGKRITADASGRPVLVDPPAPTLSEMATSAKAAIDAEAGTARARYITTAIGQEATYLLKAADADRYKAAGYPAAQIAIYQWVLARAKVMNVSPAAADYQAAADLIIATRDAWISKGSAIEEARERGKAAVSAAVDVAGVETARTASVAELILL